MVSPSRFTYKHGLYLVKLNDSETPIGMCGLLTRESLPQVDLGFAFLPEFWGKGYAFEAASVVMFHAREVLKLQCVLAITDRENEASIKLLEKLGFRFERLIKLPGESPVVKLFRQVFIML